MINMMYATLPIAHAHTNRKDDIFMQRRPYIDKANKALDIFPYSVSLGDALTTAAVRAFFYWDPSLMSAI